MMAGAAVSRRGVRYRRRDDRSLVERWPLFVRDFGLVIGVIAVYFLVRGIAPDRVEQSMAVTLELVRFEQALHLFIEPQIQEISIQSHAVQEVANFIYAYLHFPVLGAVGVWLWFRGRERFLFLRNVMVISMVIGILFYYFLPAAPPRLMAAHGYDLGFVDTVFGGNTAVSYAQPSLIQNDYAAIPSFHFGWIALASAAIWVNTRSVWLRAVAVALTLAMSWSIVATANHFWVDMALGGLVIAVAWVIGTRMMTKRSATGALASQST
jgi:hypothetical protein